jgi:predicted PurR-regulated permease PerM
MTCKHIAACALSLLGWAGAGHAAVAMINEASEDVRRAIAASQAGALSPEAEASLQKLEQALENGERVNASLHSQVASLQEERAKLQQAQTVLTSGLVGALVTAIVAILGAFVTSRNSRPDRDLKRLAVIEKVRELKAANVKLPPDLARADGSDG